MVAAVSGNSLGVSLTSLATLGQRGVFGEAAQGRSGERVYVNVASGNLVVQDDDDRLVAHGLDAVALRTYNSQGLMNDDNGDNWSNGIYAAQMQVVGKLGAAGSSIVRTAMDGAQSTYVLDTGGSYPKGTYVCTDGSGAHDTVKSVNGQLVWTDGDTRVTETYQQGGKGRLLERRDASDNAWQFNYDGRTGLLSRVRSGREQINYVYDGTRLTRITRESVDPKDSNKLATITRTWFDYDLRGRLQTVRVDLSPDDNKLGQDAYVTRYSYDGDSTRVSRIEQGDQTSLDIRYALVDGQYRVWKLTDALGQTSTYDYNTATGRTSVTDALGQVTLYDYDAKGQLSSVTGPATAGGSPATAFKWDAATGDLTDVTDGEGRKVHMTYDLATGVQLSQADAAGNSITRRYTDANQLLAETVDTGSGGVQVTRYVYDAKVKTLLLFEISAQGRVTEYRYNGFGERTTALQYMGASYDVSTLAAASDIALPDMKAWAKAQDSSLVSRTDMDYDARGQLLTLTRWASVDASGKGVAAGASVTHYTYDASGLLLGTIDASKGQTTYLYDGLGRVTRTVDPAGRIVETTYADGAALTTVLDRATGVSTTRVYDRAGRLASVVQSAGSSTLASTRYAYDADNRLLMVQDPTGVRRFTLWDAAGRKVADIDGDGTLTEYSWDRSNRLTSTTVYATRVDLARLADAGGTPLNPPLSAIRPASGGCRQVQQAYDAAGRLWRVTEADGLVTENVYDAASRIVAVRRYLPGSATSERVTRSFYDADGLLVGTLDEEGSLTEYSRDAAGRLVQQYRYITGTDAALRATGTLAQMRPARIADKDALTTYLLDGRGQVIGEVDPEGYLTETRYDAYGLATVKTRYANKAKGPVGALSRMDDIRPQSDAEDRSTTWSYDSLHRLSREIDASGKRTDYTYDAAGNLVSTVEAAGLPESRSLLARFDLLGRVTAELSAEGAQKLLAGADVESTWAQYALHHTYDAAGRRTSTTDANGLRTVFFYDADGRVTWTVNALGEVTQNRYGAFGQLTQTVRYFNRVDAAVTATLAGGLDDKPLQALKADAKDARTTYGYDALGKLHTVTDALLHSTQVDYNAFGEEVDRFEDIGDGRRVQTHTERDRRGLQTKVTADVGGIAAVTETEYDAFGRIVRTVDANHNEQRRWLDRDGRAIAVQDGSGTQQGFEYDAFDRVVRQTDARGFQTTHSYDRLKRTVTVTAGEISVVTTLDAYGRTISVVDGLGNTTACSYDANGKLLGKSNPDGQTHNDYDRGGRLIRTTDAAGRIVEFAYDGANRLQLQRIDPNGLRLETTYEYDGQGHQILVTDPQQRKTRYEYDLAGRVTARIADPDGLALATRFEYDAQGRTLRVTDPGKRVTRYEYDALGRRTAEIVDPAGLALARRYTWDAAGNVTAVTEADGGITRYTYDGANRVVFTVGPTGAVTENHYNEAGQLDLTRSYSAAIPASSLGLGATSNDVRRLLGADPRVALAVRRVLDRNGRTTATVNSLGEVVAYTYDANGNVTQRRAFAKRVADWTAAGLPTEDACDQLQRTVYDGLGRALYTVDGTGALVANRYDGSGNLVAQVAYAKALPEGAALTREGLSALQGRLATGSDRCIRYVYDGANRLTCSTDGAGAVTRLLLDGSGQVVQRIAYATATSGDPAAVQASDADRATNYAYDAAGRLVCSVDALGTLTRYVNDAGGKVVRQTTFATRVAPPRAGVPATSADFTQPPPSADDRTQRMGYDAAGRCVIAIDAQAQVTRTAYDAMGRVSTVRRQALLAATETLNDGSTLEQLQAAAPQDGADRIESYSYDAAGRLTDATNALGHRTHTDYDTWGRAAQSTDYASDGSAASRSFRYDAAGRLADSTDALQHTEHYEWDGVGNRIRVTDAKGGVWTYDHDAAGRVITETSPEVRLTGSVLDSASGQVTQTAPVSAAVGTKFGYDALGNLLSRTEAAGRPEERTTAYGYDGAGRQVRIEYPEVGVYDFGADSAANGATGVAARTETRRKLVSQTTYNAFGEAVANLDVGGSNSHKAYDKLGRILWDVDAAGCVTGYERNAFGDAVGLTRYAVQTGLGAHTGELSAQQIADAVNGPGTSHAADRRLQTKFDHAGRAIEITESAVDSYDSSADAAAQYFTAGRTSRSTYDAFGDIVQVAQLRNPVSQAWLYENRYYDKGGRLTATVDAAGFVTTQRWDDAGHLLERTEYANALQGWVGRARPAAPPAPRADASDRKVTAEYDALGRKLRETRVNVEYADGASGASGATLRGDLGTRYEYDALGNVTATIDATGAVTRSYYDALGRVVAVAEPPRAGSADGATPTTLTPLTEYLRDALGNAVATVQRAQGASRADQDGYATSDDAADRITLAAFDAAGRAIATRDAAGNLHQASFDAYGHLAKQWQGVTGNDGITHTLSHIYGYDALGRQTHVIDPSSSQDSPGWVDTSTAYNAFGEISARAVDGQVVEHTDYDNAGRAWKTDAGDGGRIRLFDLQGNTTAELRSQGAVAISMIGSASQASRMGGLRRTEQVFDASGHMVRQSLPEREELQGGVRAYGTFVQAAVVSSATPVEQESGRSWSGTNALKLTWSSLAALGSGDVRVDVRYVRIGAAHVVGRDEGNAGTYVYDDGDTVDRSFVLPPGQGAAGADLSWADTDPGDTGGILRVLDVKVWKKDIVCGWHLVAGDAAASAVEVAAPTDPSDGVRLQVRALGGEWADVPLVNFGDALRYDASALAAGSYEYRVQVTGAGGTERTSASGSFELSLAPLSVIGVPLLTSRPGLDAATLSWESPQPSVSQVLRYRLAGAADWREAAVLAPASGLSAVDLSGWPAGSYDYELLWTRAGEPAPFAHATGHVSVLAGTPPTQVPAVGAQVGLGVVVVADPAAPGQYALAVSGLPAPATELRLRPYGSTGSWTSWPLTTTFDESGSPVQTAPLASVPAGDYQYWIAVTVPGESTLLAQAIGELTISSSGGHYETRLVPHSVTTLVYPEDPAHYIVGTTAGSLTYGPPVVVGTDEAGQPIYGEHYGPGPDGTAVGIPYYATRTFSTQVAPPDPANFIVSTSLTYGYPVVVGTTDSGAPILGEHYARQSDGRIVAVPYTVTETSSRSVQRTVQPPDPSAFIVSSTRVYGPPVVMSYDEQTGTPTLGEHYMYDASGVNIVAVPFTVYDTVTRTEQVAVQVPVQVLVEVPIYVETTEPVYETRTGTRTVAYQVVVGQQPLMMYDESGNATPALDESGNPIYVDVYETQYREETYTYEVQVDTRTVQTLAGYDQQYETRYETQYETQTVTDSVPRTVVPDDPALHIIGGQVQYGPPVVLYYDDAGNPILGEHYAFDAQGRIVAVPYTVTETVYDTVTRTVTPEDPSNFITGGSVVYGPPVVVGYDEGGNPILGEHYALDAQGRIVALPYTVTSQVQDTTATVPEDPSHFIIGSAGGQPIYGPPVVVGYDEDGTPVFGQGYMLGADGRVSTYPYEAVRTEYTQESVWVADAAGAPVVTDQTPPYQAGHTLPGTPRQYSASADASPAAGAISGGAQRTTITQTRAQDGDSRLLRPVIEQSSDRWGNVTSISDPRNAAWVTQYRYDAADHMVEQRQPDADGHAGGPLTRVLYDALGRQVGVVDANGHLNGQGFDAGGNLAQEVHADGGVVRYDYDAFGERVRMVDAMGNVTRFTYDLLGRQTEVTRLGAGEAGFAVYSSGFGADWGVAPEKLGYRLERRGAIVERASYDQAGRRLTQTNGNGEVTAYGYDLRGNVTSVTVAGQLQQRAGYDNQDRKVSETDGLGNTSTWSYDAAGHLLSHGTIGGVTYSYGYDAAMQLVSQTGGGQSISYGYDAAGQVTRIVDRQPAGGAYGVKTTTFAYDLSGRRILERTVQDGVTWQDNHIAYDALGRLRWVGDTHAFATMEYDAAGNRTHIHTRVSSQAGDGTESTHTDERYYAYDAMNRQVVADAYDAAGTVLGDRGHVLGYDRNGNRVSDTFVGTRIVPESGVTNIIGYNGQTDEAIYGDPKTVYHDAGQGLVTEAYSYDGAGRLKTIERDGIQTDLRLYDAAGRLIHTGPTSALPQSYFQLANGSANGQPLPGSGTESRINHYDEQARLRYTMVMKNDFSGNLVGKSAVDYQQFDGAGNLTRYVTDDFAGAVNTYESVIAKYDGYKEAAVHASSTKMKPGSTTNRYDANGFLVGVDDATKDSLDRSFVNDASGQVLAVNQGGEITRQLIVGGQVLARYGMAPDELQPKTATGDPNMVDTNVFMFGYRPINPQFPTAAPGVYTVRSGDTLRTIAQTAYGDARLWFRIAEANGLEGDADLRAGQTLSLPNIVSGAANAYDTFQPYDPSTVVGDTTPNLPLPTPKTNWFKQLVMVVVAVVATVLTAGALSGVTYATLGELFSAGVGALGVSAAGAGIAGATAGSLGFSGFAIAGAAGSMASQAVGIATGAQDSFKFTQLALTVIGSAASAVLPIAGQPLGQAMARAAAGNLLAQGIGVATGLQQRLSWQAVAASVVGAGVGQVVSDALGTNASASAGEQFGKRLVTGLAAGVSAAAVHGGRVAVQQAAVDAFGNALGPSLIESANPEPTPQGVGSYSAVDYRNGMDIQSDQVYQARRDAEWIAQSDAIQNGRLQGIAPPLTDVQMRALAAGAGPLSAQTAQQWDALADAGVGPAAGGKQLPVSKEQAAESSAVRARIAKRASDFWSGTGSFAPTTSDNKSLWSAAKDTARVPWNLLMDAAELAQVASPFSGLALSAYRAMGINVPSPSDFRAPYDTPAFGLTMEVLAPMVPAGQLLRVPRTLGGAAFVDGMFVHELKPLTNLELYGQAATRTPDEALQLLQRLGHDAETLSQYRVVKLSDSDYAVRSRRLGFDFDATYGNVSQSASSVSFKRDISSQMADGSSKIPIYVRKEVFDSDEAIVQILSHEIHETQGLKYLPSPMSTNEYKEFVRNDRVGNLHWEAVQDGDWWLQQFRNMLGGNGKK